MNNNYIITFLWGVEIFLQISLIKSNQSEY